MRTHGGWVFVPLVAVLLTACGSGAATPTPGSSAPAATAVAGAATATASVAIAATPPASGTTPASAVPATPSPISSPTTQPTPAPTPRPTPTLRQATPPPATGGQAVSVSNFAFVPATISVKVGTRVTWTNRQAGIQHTVTADDGSFDSGALSTGSSYSHVFTKAGAYTYHCAIHPYMTATVIVTG